MPNTRRYFGWFFVYLVTALAYVNIAMLSRIGIESGLPSEQAAALEVLVIPLVVVVIIRAALYLWEGVIWRASKRCRRGWWVYSAYLPCKLEEDSKQTSNGQKRDDDFDGVDRSILGRFYVDHRIHSAKIRDGRAHFFYLDRHDPDIESTDEATSMPDGGETTTSPTDDHHIPPVDDTTGKINVTTKTTDDIHEKQIEPDFVLAGDHSVTRVKNAERAWFSDDVNFTEDTNRVHYIYFSRTQTYHGLSEQDKKRLKEVFGTGWSQGYIAASITDELGIEQKEAGRTPGNHPYYGLRYVERVVDLWHFLKNRILYRDTLTIEVWRGDIEGHEGRKEVSGRIYAERLDPKQVTRSEQADWLFENHAQELIEATVLPALANDSKD